MTTSAILLINAKRVWRGAPAAQTDVDASYPEGVDAVLIKDGLIAAVGATADLLAQFDDVQAEIAASAPAAHEPVAVLAGRPRRAAARVIDCQGRHSIYPGFIDSHVHMMDGGRHLLSPDVEFANGRESFVAAVREFVETKYVAGTWLYGGGWSHTMLQGDPDRQWLDSIPGSESIPMVIYSKDIHSCVLNTCAMRLCELLPQEDGSGTVVTQIDGGVIDVDDKGVPTGVLRDGAVFHTKKYAPAKDTAENQALALNAAEEYLLKNGITTVFSMMSTRFSDNVNEVAFLAQAEREGRMRVRCRYGVPIEAMDAIVSDFYEPVRSQVGRSDDFTAPFRFTCSPLAEGGGYCVLGAVKLFSDGSLSSRTAAMTRPYGVDVLTAGDIDSELEQTVIDTILGAGPQCRCGLLTMPRQQMREAVAKVHAARMQVVTHAIGDWAVAVVDKTLCESGEKLRASADHATDAAVAAFCREPRSRVEHFQHVANISKEVARMRANGIIASMQPCHLLFDGDYIDGLLGARRKDKAYLWGTLQRGGVRVNIGSDWPVAPAHVRDNLRGAVTRVPDVMAALAAEQSAGGEQAASAACAVKRYHDVWNAAECVPMDTALRFYTADAAYGAFLEDVVGTLEVGKFADVTVWSDDWLDESRQVPLIEGCETRWWKKGEEPQVLFTIVGGIVEFEKSR